MRRYFGTAGLIVAVVAIAGASLRADVRTEEKTHVSFAGALGRMVNMFGGKAAREGVTQTVAIKGDRRMTTTDRTAQLIDLAEEKIYDIDLDHKSYTVTTFAELRQRMEEAQAKAKERMDKAQNEKAESGEPQKKMSLDVSTKETGQRKSINGFDCHEVVTTVTVHEDGKSLEEGGGMVLTSDAWMTGAIPAMKEVQAFNRRYYEKLSGTDLAASRDQMAAAMAMYPALKEALGKVSVEGTRANGTPISTELTVESVPSPEQRQQASAQQQQQAPPTGGGLGGMLARRMMKKQQQQEKQQGGGDSGRSTVMTSTLEVLSVATDVPADAIAIPAGFKEKK